MKLLLLGASFFVVIASILYETEGESREPVATGLVIIEPVSIISIILVRNVAVTWFYATVSVDHFMAVRAFRSAGLQEIYK